MNLLQSSKDAFDPLSDVLGIVGARLLRRTRLEASGKWAFSYPGGPRLKFVALLRGQCWVLLPDQSPLGMAAGDVFLLGDTDYVVASDVDAPAVDGTPLYADPGADVAYVGSGGETVLLGGGLDFHGDAAFVLESLPVFLHIDSGTPAASAVARTLALIEAEVTGDRPGSSLVTTRLVEVLLVEALRAFVATAGEDRVGWIAALGDRRVGAALKLMHSEVACPWTVKELASRVGMSRSAFSSHFAARVGRPPLDYLIHWRMMLAQHLLGQGQMSIAAVALAVGYDSQSAFANAFKRVIGDTPRAAARRLSGRF
jgi:AraC-like DNA-binding protein